MILPPSSSGKSALDIALTTAQEAGALVRGRFYSAKEVSYKGPSDLVTDVDLLSERYIRDVLIREFPNIGYLGEELGASGDDGGWRWIVDPVDGTRNYAAGVPHFAVSIALAHGSSVVLGVTHDPMRDEIFHAAKGQGAFVNGSPIVVSQRTSVADCMLGFDLSGRDPRAIYAFELLRKLWPGMQGVRIMGSSALALAYAAAGRVDIYCNQNLLPWDVAAGLALVEEAGGQILDRQGGLANLKSTGVVASSPRLLEEFLRLIEEEAWYTME